MPILRVSPFWIWHGIEAKKMTIHVVPTFAYAQFHLRIQIKQGNEKEYSFAEERWAWADSLEELVSRWTMDDAELVPPIMKPTKWTYRNSFPWIVFEELLHEIDSTIGESWEAFLQSTPIKDVFVFLNNGIIRIGLQLGPILGVRTTQHVEDLQQLVIFIRSAKNWLPCDEFSQNASNRPTG